MKNNLFSQLEEERARQRDALQDTPLSQGQPNEQEQKEPVQVVTQPSKRLSKPLSKGLSKPIFQAVTTDLIETLAFQLRKHPKFRVNADIPKEWKDELDDMAYKLKVGKYDLMTYIVAQFLGKLGQ